VVDKPVFLIGRRAGADLPVAGRDVSRDHARIELKGGAYHIADCGSRFGTFVNGQAITVERPLAHGDKVRLGQTEAVELVFVVEDENLTMFRASEASGSVPDLVQMSAILNGLRAVGSGRVLEEVLTLVLDSALDVTSAERGFVMLAGDAGALEFKIGRGKGHRTLAGTSFATSDKIPREVFQTGRSRIVGDLLDGSLAEAHGGTIAIGIRHVLCVPLQVSAYGVSPGEARGGLRTIGVLYLDGRERGRRRWRSTAPGCTPGRPRRRSSTASSESPPRSSRGCCRSRATPARRSTSRAPACRASRLGATSSTTSISRAARSASRSATSPARARRRRCSRRPCRAISPPTRRSRPTRRTSWRGSIARCCAGPSKRGSRRCGTAC
jgi:pSer/pThr/pTyr-binding forkhead associated (FHA) protein